MSEENVDTVEKIVSREADLTEIYAEIYPILKGADRTGLPGHVVADLESLDSPEAIKPPKAAAILKSILRSTPEDRFQFEHVFGVERRDGTTLGGLVRNRLEAIGISSSDFEPYLRERGWLEGATPSSEEAAGRLVRYDTDRATGLAEDDLLGIAPEVNALAALITARNTSPPLAIGVFGDWGAGKTFFMRSLMRRVDTLSSAARGEANPEKEQRQRDIAFYKQIVQIEFNAWQYMEGNLWASLVEHIFANLRISQDPHYDRDGTKIRTLQQALLGQLEIHERAREQARAAANEAKSRWKKAEADRKEIESERQLRLQELADISPRDFLKDENLTAPLMDAINSALEAAGFDKVARELDAVQGSLSEARSTLQYGGTVVAPLLKAKDRGRRFWLLLATLVAGPLLGLLAAAFAWWVAQPAARQILAEIAAVSTAVSTFLGMMAAWLRSQARWTTEQLTRIENANRRLEEWQAEKLSDYDAEIQRLQQEASKLSADYAAARQREQAAEQSIDRLERELRQTEPPYVLASFIEDRTDTDDYRKHLGLLSQVRRDFQALSNYIQQENDKVLQLDDLADEKRDEQERISRIVLYIDDLDRCPPYKVVQVLQAVHLLLAFPLFVVVVGVDARWVSHALLKYYGTLLQGDATPQDYLEKIFQIPIWLRSVGMQDSQNMLSGLLEKWVVLDEAHMRAEALLGGSTSVDLSRSGESDEGSRGTSDGIPPPDSDHPYEIDLNPESLTIYQRELAFMHTLSPILGRSPRSIKRFVNVYWLIKATLAETSDPLSLEEGETVSDYRVVMFLLSVITGTPMLSRLFFHTIVRGHELNRQDLHSEEAGGRTLRWVIEEVSTIVRKVDAPEKVALMAAEERLRDWVVDHEGGTWTEAPLAPFARRAPQVARYSFRVQQVEG